MLFGLLRALLARALGLIEGALAPLRARLAAPSTSAFDVHAAAAALDGTPYAPAFAPARAAEPFLSAYAPLPGGGGGGGGGGGDKVLGVVEYTRADFLALACRAASALVAAGVRGRGDAHAHWFTGNAPEDLALRLAAVMLRSAAVTINWQADDPKRVAYKLRAARCRVLVVDEGVPDAALAEVLAECAAAAAADGGGDAAAEPVRVLRAASIATHPAAAVSLSGALAPPPAPEETRFVIFTSGTTGLPKGVALAHRCYDANAATFDAFLMRPGGWRRLACVLTNPMHHTNSSAIADWATRTPGARVHLVRAYTTAYWRVLAAAAAGVPYCARAPLPPAGGGGGGEPAAEAAEAAAEAAEAAAPGGGLGSARVRAGCAAAAAAATALVCPLVSRHFDFLDVLSAARRLPLPPGALAAAAASSHVVLLLGSAPVGPTTVARIRRLCGGALPTVRFGSTETTLQVLGTPRGRAPEPTLAAFEAGWGHAHADGAPCVGYYIGRPHPPHTEVDVVASVERGEEGGAPPAEYLRPCAAGVPGRLVARGANVMGGYVGDRAATARALDRGGGWYLNLGDVCFWLPAADGSGAREYYWVARESTLLIRGGANYAYEQLEAEIVAFCQQQMPAAAAAAAAARAEPAGGDGGGAGDGAEAEEEEAHFAASVVGVRVASEHEDECCVALGCRTAAAHAAAPLIVRALLAGQPIGARGGAAPAAGARALSKGARPERVALGVDVPRNFKGAVLYKELAQFWKDAIARDPDFGKAPPAEK